MSQHSTESDDGPQDGGEFPQPMDREKLLAYLKTPEGLEFLADAVREARGIVSEAGGEEPAELRRLLELENELRAASAGPVDLDHSTRST